MQVVAQYSHLNGKEFLLVHQKSLLSEIWQVIESVDASLCRTKVSKESSRQGRLLYSPVDMNKAFNNAFSRRGWAERKKSFWVTADEELLISIYQLPDREQKSAIEKSGNKLIMSYNQTDCVKDRVAVEVQFGKYTFVAHDLFVKHMSFFVANIIDMGVEILPMKELEQNMSSGVPYYERCAVIATWHRPLIL